MTTLPWRTFSSYARERFGARVGKIIVDAGFSCPNRDGTRGTGGCTFCNNSSFSPAIGLRKPGEPSLPIRLQVEAGIARALRRKASKFIVYFQPFSNTYAPASTLMEIYDQALTHPGIVGLAVGTRPDCLEAAAVDLLASYAPRLEVWLELGLQTINDETLRSINRGHTYGDFLAAMALVRGRSLKVCVHVIIGLPGETRDHNRATADALAQLPCHGLKIHPLQIVNDTAMAAQHARGELSLIGEDEFIARAADFIERTPPGVVIQRLGADAISSTLVAPAWCAGKQHLMEGVQRELERRGTRQGSLAPAGLG